MCWFVAASVLVMIGCLDGRRGVSCTPCSALSLSPCPHPHPTQFTAESLPHPQPHASALTWGPRWGPGCRSSWSAPLLFRVFSSGGLWAPSLVPETHGDQGGPAQSPLSPVCGEATHQPRPVQSWPELQSVVGASAASWWAWVTWGRVLPSPGCCDPSGQGAPCVCASVLGWLSVALPLDMGRDVNDLLGDMIHLTTGSTDHTGARPRGGQAGPSRAPPFVLTSHRPSLRCPLRPRDSQTWVWRRL